MQPRRHEATKKNPVLPSLVIAALGLVVLTPAIRAQSPADYGSLVALYADGRGNEAVAALLKRSKDELTNAAKAAAGTLPARDLIAAAMLHTEGEIEEPARRRYGAAGVFRRRNAFRIFATTVKFGSTTLATSYSVACPMNACAPRSV